ncbi:Aspartic protease [Phytophthora megakarya]|uniref:Aspartic protease n=1 Tax=Phytophthora megakarya TaxID=4795 RepID=A0A225X0M3_9STRA|nr:Aspartic protease [Phytophthora megakarya]
MGRYPFGKLMVWIYMFVHTKHCTSNLDITPLSEFSMDRVISNEKYYRWVTQLIYNGKSWPVAVKVANVSSRRVWIDTQTALARIVEFEYFPTKKFVRPELRRYQGWESLIYETTVSMERRLLQERLEQLKKDVEPPCIQSIDYSWPTKLMTRSPSGTGEV